MEEIQAFPKDDYFDLETCEKCNHPSNWFSCGWICHLCWTKMDEKEQKEYEKETIQFFEERG